MSIEIHPSQSRFVTREAGRETFHSFSFGAHYDPRNTGFASMAALNDENLPRATGYADHPHRDVEIVTWVLEGVLRHSDSVLGTRELGPGEVLRTSAGSGIVHSEVAGPRTRTRFLQTWLRPDQPGGTPSLAAGAAGVRAELTQVVGGDALPLGTSGASLFLARPGAGSIVLPDAPRMLLFVADGVIEIGERAVHRGDSARLSDEGARSLVVPEAATIAVWAFRD